MALAAAVGFFFVAPTPGQGPKSDARLKAQVVYHAARARFRERPNDLEAAWQLARACFERADSTPNEQDLAAFAKEGIEAARRAVSIEPNSAPAHYYLALNLGELARTKTLGAAHLVRQMEKELQTAAKLDEKFDHGGADRCLGILYSQAPGWPVSIGDPKKAQTHLEKAVALDPEFPENRLALMEGLVRAGRPIEREAKEYESNLPNARKKLAGPDWTADWADWESRWEKLQAKR